MQLAFVIKNHIPYSYKATLLHQKYGKIVAIFSKNDQAMLLTSGSLIWCSLQKKNNVYEFLNIEIESQVAVEHVPFVHDIMKLCLYQLPSNICVPEFFDFLLYVHNHMNFFCSNAQKVVMLRLFLMLDLLDQEAQVYQMAILNPMNASNINVVVLAKYVTAGWNNFYRLQKLEKID